MAIYVLLGNDHWLLASECRADGRKAPKRNGSSWKMGLPSGDPGAMQSMQQLSAALTLELCLRSAILALSLKIIATEGDLEHKVAAISVISQGIAK